MTEELVDISNINFKKEFLELTQSHEFSLLRNFYEKKSYLEILGVARQETVHSNFLAWVLNPFETHRVGDYNIKNLLKTAVISVEKTGQEKPLWLSPEFENAIVCDNYTLTDIQVVTEKVIDSKKRIDIFISCKMSINHLEPFDLLVIIENKVKSSEHDMQTCFYREWAEKQVTAANSKVVCLYLTPILMLELIDLYQSHNASEHKKKPCDKNYIHINYQMIMDYVLQPLAQRSIDQEARERIYDYMRGLSLNSLIQNNDNKNKDESIMAISAEEKELVNAFCEKYHDILTAISLVQSEDETLDPSEREMHRNIAKKQSEKDYTKYNVFYKGEKLNNLPAGKNKILFLIAKKEMDLDTKEQFFEFLINNLSQKIRKVILPVERISDNTRYHDEVFEYRGEEYKISNQWGVGNLPVLLESIGREECLKDFSVIPC